MMAKVVQTRPVAGGRASDPDFPGEAVKPTADLSPIQTVGAVRDKELRQAFTEGPITLAQIFGECFLSRGMDRYQGGPAEFGTDDDQDGPVQVHLLGFQVQHLAHAQACHRQQAQQAILRQSGQTAHLLSRLQQLADLLIGVEVRACAGRAIGKQVVRRDLRLGIERAPVAGKTADTR